MLGRRTGGRADGRSVTRRVLSGIRRIAGMPDYGAHLEHLRRSHPERPIPTEREFYEEFVRNRYGDGPTRCC
ncbi:MAG TPA: YbdD/YjiX family protein [Gemmatimonadales bacterium]|nr:YbdD/YjiX family protein [Gemmatimonadales bacterium]